MDLAPKELQALKKHGISINTNDAVVEVGLGSVGKDYLLLVSGDVNVRNDRGTTPLEIGDLVSRQFFQGGDCSAVISSYSHCLLLTQEVLDYLTQEEPKLAAKLYRHFGTAFIRSTIDLHNDRTGRIGPPTHLNHVGV